MIKYKLKDLNENNRKTAIICNIYIDICAMSTPLLLYLLSVLLDSSWRNNTFFIVGLIVYFFINVVLMVFVNKIVIRSLYKKQSIR